jgi:hypothetical protein
MSVQILVYSVFDRAALKKFSSCRYPTEVNWANLAYEHLILVLTCITARSASLLIVTFCVTDWQVWH